MTASQPLQGTELIDCAKANAKQGIATAAKQYGYGEDLKQFSEQLKLACDRIGIGIDDLSNLITDRQRLKQMGGIEIAPDTPSQI